MNFVLADLGVSSMQIDDPKRGFSFREEGPLDLRLNPQAGVPASKRLKEMDAEEIEGMLFENSDEPLARELARAIMSAKRKKQPIETTSELREIVEQVVLRTKPENPKEAVKKTCQRVFQALRIDVNSEFEVLDSFLEALPHILKPGGKAAILTFHSGEDRMVKKSFQYYAREGIYSDIAKDVIRPSAKECASNPRARSTKFRWAVRSDVQNMSETGKTVKRSGETTRMKRKVKVILTAAIFTLCTAIGGCKAVESKLEPVYEAILQDDSVQEGKKCAGKRKSGNISERSFV